MSNPFNPYGGNPPGNNPYGNNPYGNNLPANNPNNPYPVYNNYGSYTDRDGVNEAEIAARVLGGPVRLNDSVEADVMDPVFFNTSSFSASAIITAISDIGIKDDHGEFYFLMFGLRGDLDYLVVEADTMQYARAFVAREVKDYNLGQFLLKQKDAYLADSNATTWPCDLSEWDMGQWTMFAYRNPGRIIVRDGKFEFFNAQIGYPIEYWDFTLCPAGQEGPNATNWLRYVSVGHNQAILRGDLLDLSRGSQGPLKVWRQNTPPPPPKKKGLFGF